MRWSTRVEEEVHRRHPGLGVWYTRLSRQPGWVTRTAFIIAILVVVLPIVALALTAAVVGLACLLILGSIAKASRFISDSFKGGLRTRDDGRRNVRVIERP